MAETRRQSDDRPCRRRLSLAVDLLTQEIEAPASLANPGLARELGRIRDAIVDVELGRRPWWRRPWTRIRRWRADLLAGQSPVIARRSMATTDVRRANR